jgi:hypothetical protein
LWERAEQSRQRTEVQSRLGALQIERDQLEQSLAMLEANLERFRALQRGGFVGSGDRIAWTEALLRVRQRLGLPDIAFELAAQQMLEPVAADPALVELGGQTPSDSGPIAHDLRFQAAGLHEGELLAVLEGLQAEAVGFFRPQRCQLQRATQGGGLEVDCSLRWITYLPPAPEAPPDAAEEAAP